jgi:hypothetical protein
MRTTSTIRRGLSAEEKAPHLLAAAADKQRFSDLGGTYTRVHILECLYSINTCINQQGRSKVQEGDESEERQRCTCSLSLTLCCFTPSAAIKISFCRTQAPKAAKSSYIFYCTEKRPVLKEEQPELSFSEVGTGIATQLTRRVVQYKLFAQAKRWGQCGKRSLKWKRLKASVAAFHRTYTLHQVQYFDLATTDKKRYRDELSTYEHSKVC